MGDGFFQSFTALKYMLPHFYVIDANLEFLCNGKDADETIRNGIILRTSSAVCSFEILEAVSQIRGLPREEAILWVCESIMEATRFAEKGESVKRTLRKDRK